jgi:hypothetical protein
MQLVPRTVTRRIPVDMYGNVILETPMISTESRPSSSLINPSESTASPSDAAPRASKKPATESGELPAPQGKANGEVANGEKSGAAKAPTAELNIGPAQGDAEAQAKPSLPQKSESSPAAGETKIDSDKPATSTEESDKPTRIRTQQDD